jgi:hypothetical protein
MKDWRGRDRGVTTMVQDARAKDEVARLLARKHFEIEDGITHIYRLTDRSDVELRPSEPIKLLEVNAATVPSGVLPLHFGPAPASGIPFSSIIIEVTPIEFEKIRSHELELPKGWSIGEEIIRSVELNGN